MSTLCLAFVLFAAQPAEGNNLHDQPNAAISTDRPESAAPVRQGKELEAATRMALRRWAKVDEATAPAAARELIDIFNELKADASLSHSKRQQLGGQVRGRLVRLAGLLPKSNGENRGHNVPPHLGDVQNNPNILGQMGGGMNQPGGIRNRGGGGQRGGFGGNPLNNFPQDAGEDLVGLIQKTIAPSSWDVNGGPGSIRYWRPTHALVIRATEDVHEQIGGVLGQLHRGQQ